MSLITAKAAAEAVVKAKGTSALDIEEEGQDEKNVQLEKTMLFGYSVEKEHNLAQSLCAKHI